MQRDNNILICTGGTGGHVIPAINFGNYLISKGYNCSLILDDRGKKYSNNFQGNIFCIQSSHLTGNLFFKIKSILNLIIGFIQSIFYLIRIKPKHCISFGSYAALMPLFICTFFKQFKKIDIHIHEQNLVMGRVNLLFLSFATNIFTNFEKIENLKKKYFFKTYHVGLPLSFKKNIPITKSIVSNININKTIVFIYGGSQGSIPIINCFLSMLNYFTKEEIQKIELIIQSPKKISENIIKKLNKLKAEYLVKDFYHNIDEILKITDIVIARAGAGTLNDIINYNIPSIIFPLPHSMNNHQIKNAKYLANKRCAIIMDENKFDQQKNSTILRNLVKDLKKRQIMKNILNKIPNPNANKLMFSKLTNV